MITYHYQTKFSLKQEQAYTEWLDQVARSENKTAGIINYIFCSDEELLQMNIRYLQHDYYTDIITFDYTEGKEISGDVFISVDRVFANAAEYRVGRDEEIRRVMVHGILHLAGYRDDTTDEKNIMRNKENDKLELFHVEQ